MKDGTKVAAMLAMILQLGIMMIVPIVFCTIGGAWIGRALDAGWIAVVGFLVGALAGMRACARIIKGLISDMPYDETSRRALWENRKRRADDKEACKRRIEDK